MEKQRKANLFHKWCWESWTGCAYAQSYPTLCDPWTIAHQDPLSMEFFRQEYWNGLPFPTLGELPDPGIKPKSLVSPALASHRCRKTGHLHVNEIRTFPNTIYKNKLKMV